ncbi:MAG: hypothetical protein ACLFS7_07640 [Desulfosudaceae bacterium]
MLKEDAGKGNGVIGNGSATEKDSRKSFRKGRSLLRLPLFITILVIAAVALGAADSKGQTTCWVAPGSFARPSIPSFPELDFDNMGFDTDNISTETLDFGEDIQSGDQIDTDELTRKVLNISDSDIDGEVVANPESSYSIEGSSDTEEIDIEQFHGMLKQKIDALPEDFDYSVRTPIAVLGSRGTEFLSSIEEDRTIVAVFDSEVEVSSTDSDESLIVGADELVVVEDGEEFPSSTTSFTEEDAVRTAIELVGCKQYVDGAPHESEPYLFIAGVWDQGGGLEDVVELRVDPPYQEELILEPQEDDEGVVYGFEKEVTYEERPDLEGFYTFTFEVDEDGDDVAEENYRVDLEYTYQEEAGDYVNITEPEDGAEDVSLTPEFQWESVPEKYDFIGLEVIDRDAGERVFVTGPETDETAFELQDEDALEEKTSYRLSMPLIEEETEIKDKDNTELPFRFKYNMINATTNEVQFTTVADDGGSAGGGGCFIGSLRHPDDL